MDELNDVLRRSTQWLLDNQDAESGGWGDRPGAPPSTLNTAEVIIALMDGNAVAPGDVRIKKAAKYLTRHQLENDPDRGAWPREITTADGGLNKVPDILRTSCAIEALIKSGVAVGEQPVKIAVEWLLDMQNDMGGWGHSRGGNAAITPTCFTLRALCVAHRAGLRECEEALSKGLKLLVEKGNFRHNDGSFGEGRLKAVHTTYAAFVLQSADICKVSPYSAEKEAAIKWLLSHPNKARKLEEEMIAIDPKTGKGNYGYLFMADSLLLQVLASSNQPDHYNSKAANDALMSIAEKQDVCGGFYGYRVFSWSTSKIISALGAARLHYQKFPERQPEHSMTRVLWPIIGIAVLFSAIFLFLSLKNEFQWIHTVFLIFMMLAVLLAGGLIGEATFVNLAKRITTPFRKSS